MPAQLITLPEFGAAMAGLGALSTASFGLLDATKAFGGGVSLIGKERLRRGLAPFAPAMAAALGPDAWWPIVRANWIAGVAKADQKAKVIALIRLGITPETATALAKPGQVDAATLAAAAAKLAKGAELNRDERNVLGRLNAVVEATMDAAFEEADREYRNTCRVLAGVVALGLALLARGLFWRGEGDDAPSWWMAVMVGLLAVPLAPVAKDLTSALSSAVLALKSVSRQRA